MIARLLAFLACCCLVPASVAAKVLARADRAAVLEASAVLLEQRYVFADQGRKLAAQLRSDGHSDHFRNATEPKAFAAALTERLRALSGDGHLGLDYSEKPLAADKAEAESTYSAAEMERWYGAHLNHGFEQVRRLEGNIGYLDLRVFAPPPMAGDVAAAAMTLLAQSDALIIDLRENGGGDGALGKLMAAYLFDGKAQPMSGTYHRPTDKLTPSTTPEWVPGRKIGSKKPVYVLTSKRTFSAAEAFAYDLQALKRVTVVGEPSGGGAHPFEYRRVHPHFVLWLAEGRSVNPITRGNWQGTGVKPDVAVAADAALDTALGLARSAAKDQKASQ
jgi:C-terminal processing protease CtpA/Prc